MYLFPQTWHLIPASHPSWAHGELLCTRRGERPGGAARQDGGGAVGAPCRASCPSARAQERPCSCACCDPCRLQLCRTASPWPNVIQCSGLGFGCYGQYSKGICFRKFYPANLSPWALFWTHPVITDITLANFPHEVFSTKNHDCTCLPLRIIIITRQYS